MVSKFCMILGFLGKGGSGKSSVSWLVTQVLLAESARVLAVDADHNMDLAHLLDVAVTDTTPTLHRAHRSFLDTVGQERDSRWHEIVLDGRELPTFTLNPKDAFTKSVTSAITPQLDLLVVGLGAEDVLFSSRCAHGHSAPLKYYLPLLQLKENQYCVIDGVAGVDMMHFGLFAGTDAIVVVVEPQPNSIRVYREVARIAAASDLPVFAIINKSKPGNLRDELTAELGDRLLAELTVDEGMLTYDFEVVGKANKLAIRDALTRLRAVVPAESRLERLRSFECKRQSQPS